METDWIPLSNFRETTIDISGGFYSAEFAEKTGRIAQTGEKIGDADRDWAFWIPDPVIVRVNEDGSISCRYCSFDDFIRTGSDFTFETFLGTFVSHDCGEFGGEMVTPQGETLRGNFNDVFEYGGKVYAIDNLVHGGLGRLNIYEFSKDSPFRKIYSNDPHDCASYCGRYEYGGKEYIFLDGYIETTREDGHWSYMEKSRLLSISESGLSVEAEFDRWFYHVYNFVVLDGKLIIGMDKIAAVFDIKTRNLLSAYTLIEPENEAEIIRMKGIIRSK